MSRLRLSGIVCVLLVAALISGCTQSPAVGGNTEEGRLPSLNDVDSALPAEDPGLPNVTAPGNSETPPVGPTEPSGQEDGTDPALPTAPTDPTPTGPAQPTEPPQPTEPTEPEKEEPPQTPGLEERLTQKLADLPGTWSVYVKNVSTGETVSIHDAPMTAASLIKLYVAGAYYSTDPQAADASRCSQVDSMINVSSNEACNALIDLLGMDAINAFIRGRGDTQSVLNRKMLQNNGKENYVTARACGRILEQILNGSYVSPAASARLLQNLKDQARTGKIPAGVPKGTQTANKTGELSNTENDAAIIWSPGGTYILCVMSTDLSNTASARQSIVEISRMVYEYFNAS